MLLAPTWKVTVVPGAAAWVTGWLVMLGWPQLVPSAARMIPVARRLSLIFIVLSFWAWSFGSLPQPRPPGFVVSPVQGVFRRPITPRVLKFSASLTWLDSWLATFFSADKTGR